MVATCTREGQHKYALIDSGAAGNFMDLTLAHKLPIPLQALSNPAAVLGEPLQGG